MLKMFGKTAEEQAEEARHGEEYRDRMAKFEAIRQEFFRSAVKDGLRIASRPAGLKVDEANITLLPDNHHYYPGDEGWTIQTHGTDRDPVVTVSGKLSPLGLETADGESGTFIHIMNEEVGIICFADVPFSGKCRITVRCAALVIWNKAQREYRLYRAHDRFDCCVAGKKPPAKIVLIPVEAMKCTKRTNW